MEIRETIAAIATAVSNEGISIIRISGEEAIPIADRIFQGKIKLKDARSHTIHYGRIFDEEKEIDEVLVSVMRGPHSYTTEDVVEVNCHGGAVVTQRVLDTILSHGARAAEPGEFTKRAFLNGRIDLSQAEAVMGVIEAENDFALEASMHSLHGVVFNKIKEMRQELLEKIAYIEAALDDPEHISLDGFQEKMEALILKLEGEFKKLMDNFENGRIRSEGVKTVILGKPNAGKSSLLNLLVGKERAIVSDIEGTTRDTLEEKINLSGITLNIIDTAGIRQTDNEIEKIGVQRAYEQANQADLIIYVVDSSKKIDENDKQIVSSLKDRQMIVLLNKSDLEKETSLEDLQELIPNKTVISISAKNQIGLEELTEEIKRLFYQDQIHFNSQIYITNARQKNCIKDAYESLKLVEESVKNQMPEDFYSIDLTDCYESLGKVIGESLEEDVVKEIFAKFCMGK